jgi:phosphatidylglycerophosphate synthase
VGIGACVAVATDRWFVGAILWLLNRVLDGLDGPLARRIGETQLGGFLDIMADFAIYGGLIVAIGWSVPDARLAALVVFLGYYLNGSAFLAWSSLAQGHLIEGDGRSLHFPGGLAEGTETILAMLIILLIGRWTEELLWAWGAIVAVTVLQRIRFVATNLVGGRSSPGDEESAS